MCPIGARSVFTSHETAFTAGQTNFMIESSTGLSRDEFDGLRAELAWRLVETAALGRPRSGRGRQSRPAARQVRREVHQTHRETIQCLKRYNKVSLPSSKSLSNV